jgi:hypothetical protein
LINSTIAANRNLVEQLISGAFGDNEKIRINKTFGSITGKEAFAPSPRAEPEIRPTYGVAVVLRHKPKSVYGFTLVTAFPINE